MPLIMAEVRVRERRNQQEISSGQKKKIANCGTAETSEAIQIFIRSVDKA